MQAPGHEVAPLAGELHDEAQQPRPGAEQESGEGEAEHTRCSGDQLAPNAVTGESAATGERRIGPQSTRRGERMQAGGRGRQRTCSGPNRASALLAP